MMKSIFKEMGLKVVSPARLITAVVLGVAAFCIVAPILINLLVDIIMLLV